MQYQSLLFQIIEDYKIKLLQEWQDSVMRSQKPNLKSSLASLTERLSNKLRRLNLKTTIGKNIESLKEHALQQLDLSELLRKLNAQRLTLLEQRED